MMSLIQRRLFPNIKVCIFALSGCTGRKVPIERINSLSPIYFPSECNVDKDLFLPVVSVSQRLRCMTGYFSSGVLSELAFSISLFLNRNMTEPMRFIISPHLSDEDRLALFQAYEADDNIFNILFPEGKITAEQIREYT